MQRDRSHALRGNDRRRKLRCRVRLILVNRLNACQHFIRQLQIDAGNVAVQLLKRRGANDVAGYEWLLCDERQRHLRRVQTVLTGQCHVTAARRFRLRVEIAAEAAVEAQATFGGRAPPSYLPDRKPNASGE